MEWPWGRKGKERDLDEEIQTHLALEIQQRIEAGLTPADAESSARRAFGNIGLVEDATRSVWGYG